MNDYLSKFCPYCDGLPRLLGTSQTGDMMYWIECMSCGAHTYKFLLKARAVRDWLKDVIYNYCEN